jgi:arylsulfatase A-like enzyme
VHGPYHVDALNQDLRYTPKGFIKDVMDYELDRNKLKETLKQVPVHKHHKYVGMVSLDHHVGLIMKKLKELHLDQNTVIFFMSDHNTEPGKVTCYEKGNRIPMIIKWPGKSQSGTTSNVLVQTIDMLPTILAGANIPVPSNCKLDGKNILSVIENQSEKVRAYVYFESGYARAVTDAKWKYLAVHYPKDVI